MNVRPPPPPFSHSDLHCNSDIAAPSSPPFLFSLVWPRLRDFLRIITAQETFYFWSEIRFGKRMEVEREREREPLFLENSPKRHPHFRLSQRRGNHVCSSASCSSLSLSHIHTYTLHSVILDEHSLCQLIKYATLYIPMFERLDG